MNSVQMHLALTHVPVLLSLVGLIMLIVGFIIKNNTVIKTSYVLLFISGMAALPVYFSGEGAEEAVENLPGVSENIIESHEEIAKFSMISIAAAGFFSLAALFAFARKGLSRIFRIVVLLLAITSGGLMIQTAHLGGQIRHTEIRNGGVSNEAASESGSNEAHHRVEDND